MAEDKKTGSSLASGVTGAVIGAAAAAAAIVLSDEKNRKKAEQVLKDLQKKGDKVLKEVTSKAMDLLQKTDKVLPAGKKARKTTTKRLKG